MYPGDEVEVVEVITKWIGDVLKRVKEVGTIKKRPYTIVPMQSGVNVLIFSRFTGSSLKAA